MQQKRLSWPTRVLDPAVPYLPSSNVGERVIRVLGGRYAARLGLA